MPEYDLGTARGRIVIDGSGAAQGMDQVSAATGKMAMTQEQAGSTLQQTGLAMMGVGGAAVAGFALAVKSSADFEKRISAVGAVSGATEGEIDKLRDKALQLGKDTAFSATESAMAMEELVKAGLGVDDVLNGAADATVALAAAGEVALPEAAAIAANAMNQFNLSASEMPKIADLIAGAANASAIDVSDFGMSMAQAGATANLVGLSFDDLALGITAMGNAGIKGSDAGTSLKTMLMNLQPGTNKQKALFDELGITTDGMANKFFDANGKIRSLADIAGVLEGALAGMTEQQKMATLETMFGSDAIRAAAVVAEEGAGGMAKLSEEIGKISAEDVAEKRMDNLAGAIERFKGSVETVLIQAGSPFQKVLTKIVDFAGKLIDLFGSLPAPVQTVLTSLLALAGSALLLAGAGSFVLGTFLKFGTTLRDFKAALGVVREIGLVTRAMNLLNLSFLTNPVFLVIAALVALGFAFYTLYQRSEGFRNFIDGVWQGIQRVWDVVLEFLKDLPRKIGEFFGRAIDWIKKNWDILLAVFTGPIGGVILLFRRFGDDIFNFFKSIPGRVVEALSNFWSGVVNIFNEFPGNVIGFIEDGIETLVGFFTGIPGRIAGALGGLAGGIGGFFSNLFGGGDDAKKEVEKNFKDIEDGIVVGVDGVKKAVSNGADYRNGTWYLGDFAFGYAEMEDSDITLTKDLAGLRARLGEIADYRGDGYWYVGDVRVAYSENEDSQILFQNLEEVSEAADATSSVWERFTGTLSSGWETISGFDFGSVFSWLTDLPGKISTVVSLAGPMLLGWLTELPGRAGELIGQFVGTIVGFLMQLPGRLMEVGGQIIGTIWSFLSQLPGMALDAGFRFVEGLISFLSQLPMKIGEIIGFVMGSIVGFVTNLVSRGGEAGSGFLSAITNFITQLPGRIAGFLTQTFQRVVAWVPQMIGKAIELGSAFLNSVIQFVSQLPGRVASFLSQLPGRIMGFVGSVASAARSVGQSIISGIVDFIGNIPARVGEIITRIGSAITSAAGAAARAATNFAAGIWNGFKRGLGIRSPSYLEKATTSMVKNIGDDMKTLRRQVGQMQGLERGLPRMSDVDYGVAVSNRAIGSGYGAGSGFGDGSGGTGAAEAAPTLLVQGPLVAVDSMEVRSEEDIRRVSRDLADLISAEQLAQGRKVLRTGGVS